MAVKATVVIRCFNEEKHIGKLLHGIVNQEFDDGCEILIVDSGSADDTVRIAEQYPVAVLTIPSREFSFGRALNLGCAGAKGEFLVFVSAHVYPQRDDWLKNLLLPFENPKIASVYGKQRGGTETQYSEHQVFAKWFPEESVLVQDTPFSNNANCAVRRSLWEQFPYDEELTGLEDLEWAKRIMENGHKISYAAAAEVVHVHDETPAQTLNRYRREAIAHKRIYDEQEMSFFNFLGLLLTNIFSDYAHAVNDRLFVNNIVNIPRFRLMQFWGAFKGLKQAGPVTDRLKETFYYPLGLPRNGKTHEKDSPGNRIDYDTPYQGKCRMD